MRTLQWLSAMAISLLVAACGGGGGGGGGDAGGGAPGGGGGGGTDTSSRGLLPAAPTPGEILFADASVLRPMRSGARWVYRGSSVPAAGQPPSFYSNTMAHGAVSANGTLESYSNPLGAGSPDSQRLELADGAVSSISSIDFAGRGNAETVRLVELRSPVRRGEQYTIVDRRYTDTNNDTDGDRLGDTLDVAIYVRVIGVETIELPNLPPMSALRTETVIRQRLTPSGGGQPMPVREAMGDTWYVAGIGPVRQRFRTPTPSGNDVSISDEQLVSFDGGTVGLGPLQARASIVAGSNVFSGLRVPGGFGILAAYVAGDSALVATSLPGGGGSTGTLIHQMDKSGEIQASVYHPTLIIGSRSGFVPTGDGLLYWEQPFDNFTAQPQIRISRFADNGAAIGGIGSVTLQLGHPANALMLDTPSVAVNGSTAWVLWARRRNNPTEQVGELVLQGFSLDGTALAPEQVIDNSFSTRATLTASAGGLVLGWVRAVTGVGYELRTERRDSSGARVHGTTLLTFLSNTGFARPILRRTDVGDVVLWPTPFETAQSGPAAGVIVDAAGAVLLAQGTTVATQLLPDIMWPTELPAVSASGARLATTWPDGGRLWADDPANSERADRLTWFDTRAALPLAGTAPKAIRAPVMGTSWQLQWPDRVVQIGSDSAGMLTRLVWLPPP